MAKTKETKETTDAPADSAEATEAADAAVEAEAGAAEDTDDEKAAWEEFEEADKKDAEAATPPGDRAEATPSGATADAPAGQPADAAAGEAGEPATPTDAAAGQEKKTDDEIWAGATDAQRDAFKLSQERAAGAEAQDRRNRGSISGMQRQINDLTGRLDPKEPKTGEDDDGQAETEADAKWANFAKEYPEVAEPVNERLNAKDARIDTLERSLAAVSGTHKAQLYERNEDRLATQHPDWEAVMGVEGSQENPVDVTAAANRFASWLGQQPAYLQQAAIRNSDSIVDPEEAGHVIQVYKLASGIGQQESASAAGDKPAAGEQKPKALPGKRQRQIESAAAPRTKGAGPVTTGIPDDPEGAWEAFDKMGL